MLFDNDPSMEKHDVLSLNPMLQSVSHHDLISIIEGFTPSDEDTRDEAIRIYNELFPELSLEQDFNLETIENPMDFDPFGKDLL